MEAMTDKKTAAATAGAAVAGKPAPEKPAAEDARWLSKHSRNELSLKAEEAINSGRYLLAETISNLLRELAPDSPQWLELRAHALHKQGLRSEAIRLFEECIISFPKSIKSIRHLMNTAIDLKDYHRVLELTKSPSMELSLAKFVVKACDALAGRGELTAALEGLEPLFQLGTDDVDTYIRASRFAVQLGEFQRNRRVLAALQKLRPHNVYGYLADFHEANAQADTVAARAALIALNDKFPNNPLILSHLCENAIDAYDVEDARLWLPQLRGKISDDRIRKLELRIAACAHDWQNVVKLLGDNIGKGGDHRNQILGIYALINTGRETDARAMARKAEADPATLPNLRRWFAVAQQVADFKHKTGKFSTDADYVWKPGPAPKGEVVPPVVRTLWVGGNLSPFEVLSLKSFVANGIEAEIYTYGDVTGVPDGVKICDATEIMPRSAIFAHSEKSGRSKGSFAGFADIYRWQLLRQKGGFWTDCDIVCLRPFTLPDRLAISSEMARTANADHMAVTNCFYGGPAGHPLFEKACSMLDFRPEDLAWGELGTQLIGQLVDDMNLEAFVLPQRAFNAITPYRVIPAMLAGSRDEFDRLTADSWGVHLYNEVWRSHGQSKHGPFPRDCALHHLFARYDVRVDVTPPLMPELWKG